MKSLVECLTQVNEAFDSSILRRIVSDLKSRQVDFKKVMLSEFAINVWSTIKDSDIIQDKDVDAAAKKVRQQIRNGYVGDTTYFIIGYKDNMPDLMTIYQSTLVFNERTKWSRIPHYTPVQGERTAIEMYKSCDKVYFIPFKRDEIRKIRSIRYDAQQGSINFDEETFAKIAEENKKRYNAILSAAKAQEVNKDISDLLRRLNAVQEKTFKKFEELLKDPILNAEKLNELQYFINPISGEYGKALLAIYNVANEETYSAEGSSVHTKTTIAAAVDKLVASVERVEQKLKEILDK